MHTLPYLLVRGRDADKIKKGGNYLDFLKEWEEEISFNSQMNLSGFVPQNLQSDSTTIMHKRAMK